MVNTYLVNDVYPCLQGEGVNAGLPMVLLRLQGCEVGCPWCDTQETWLSAGPDQVASLHQALGANRYFASVPASYLANYIYANYPNYPWVMLTGGEPARQDLSGLVGLLHERGFKVAIETSGTETGHLGCDLDWICVSPKFDMPGGKAVLPAAVAPAHELKMVVGKPADIIRLDRWLLENGGVLRNDIAICLQPVSQSAKATELCVRTVQQRGWRLSLQLHKYIQQR